MEGLIAVLCFWGVIALFLSFGAFVFTDDWH